MTEEKKKRGNIPLTVSRQNRVVDKNILISKHSPAFFNRNGNTVFYLSFFTAMEEEKVLTNRATMNKAKKHPEYKERKKEFITFLQSDRGIIWPEILDHFEWARGDALFGHSELNLIYWSNLSPFFIGMLFDMIQLEEINLVPTEHFTYVLGSSYMPKYPLAKRYPTRKLGTIRWWPACIASTM